MAVSPSTAGVTSLHRVQPKRPTAHATTTFLSIVDATVVTFGAATALWVFEPSSEAALQNPDLFIQSLAESLSFYPHFAGQLALTPWPQTEHVDHTHRFRRPFITHGFADDPGVALEFTSVAMSASTLFPDRKARSTTQKTWDLTAFDLDDVFSPSCALATCGLKSIPDTPCVSLRISTLTCGSVVIVPQIAHALADAEAMIAFMKVWGQVHSALLYHQPIPCPSPLFNPALLDARARGDIDAAVSDPALLEESWALPLPRYDWWEHRPGHPSRLDESPQVKLPTEIPVHVLDSRRRGTSIPWEEWDLAAPVSHMILHITGNELDSLYQSAIADQGSDLIEITRHDVVLAFIWHMTVVAKPQQTGNVVDAGSFQDIVSLDTTLGLRLRLGLPPSFVGAPILLAGLPAPRPTIAGSCSRLFTAGAGQVRVTNASFPDFAAIAAAATLIRRHISKFDQTALGAWLHEQAFEIAPQRWWNGFLGSRHLLATSWVRSGLWEVDFGLRSPTTGPKRHTGSVTKDAAPRSDSNLRWAGVIGSKVDGLTTLLEAEGGHGRHWWLGGMNVDMKLESTAMARIIDLVSVWRQSLSK